VRTPWLERRTTTAPIPTTAAEAVRPATAPIRGQSIVIGEMYLIDSGISTFLAPSPIPIG
jgi:hypothetical protein